MTPCTLLAGLTLLSLPRVAAPSEEIEAYRERVDRIVATALAEGRAYEMLAELCRVAPHRLAGSPGSAAAVEWGLQTMRRAGLENVRAEEVVVPHWERGTECALRIAEPTHLAGTALPALALGGSVATPPTGVSGELVVVTSFEELDARDDVEGKIVLFNRPFDPTLMDTFAAYGRAVDQRSRGAIEAAKRGAVAAVVRSMTGRIDDNPHTGGMRYTDGVERIPTCAVSTRGAELLAARVAAGERVRLNLVQDCRWHEDAISHNVVGEVVGTEKPDEVVVVGGHLDAWDVGQGAHDCGAGCCHAIEAARLLLATGLRPRRTLRVVLFANEENGLRGGRAYRAAYEAELDRHVLAIESDRGGFTPRGFSADVTDEALERLREIAALLEDAGAGLVRPGHGGADIGPLRSHGVPLVGYLPDPHRYFDLHHSPADTIDAVNPRELELGAAVIAALAYVVADLEEPLPRRLIDATE